MKKINENYYTKVKKEVTAALEPHGFRFHGSAPGNQAGPGTLYYKHENGEEIGIDKDGGGHWHHWGPPNPDRTAKTLGKGDYYKHGDDEHNKNIGLPGLVRHLEKRSKIHEDVPTNNISGGKVAGTTADSVGVSVKAQNKYRLKNMRNAPGSMLRRKSPVTEEKEFKLGDNVHLGLATKGGAGFKGRLIKINGDEVLVRAHTQNKFGTRVWKGSKKNLSLDEAFKNWTVEFKPGDKVKVISGDHTGKRGMVLSKHDRGSAYTIKHTDGSIMKHHISTLDSHIYS